MSDRPPVAKCASKSCVRFLAFERNYIGQWECACPDCCDADYDYERGKHYRTDPVGCGTTADAAFEAYCERADALPEELLVTGEAHV